MPPPAWLMVGGGAVTVLAAFSPWQRVGKVSRSGFALARAAELAGLASGWRSKLLLSLFYLLPVLVAAAATAVVLGRLGAAALLGGSAGAVALGAGAYVVASPVPVEAGSIVCAGAGCVAFAGAAWMARRRRRR